MAGFIPQAHGAKAPAAGRWRLPDAGNVVRGSQRADRWHALRTDTDLKMGMSRPGRLPNMRVGLWDHAVPA